MMSLTEILIGVLEGIANLTIIKTEHSRVDPTDNLDIGRFCKEVGRFHKSVDVVVITTVQKR